MKQFIRLRSINSLGNWLLVVMTAWSGLVSAGPNSFWSEGLQVHGFLTQGFVKTTDNNFFGDSENGSYDFRELGLNGSLRFNPRWMVSAQLLSRMAGEMYDGSIALDYGLIDYTAYSNGSSRFGLHLGRFKNPLGLYNDTRDVAATRPSIFMPQAIYWDKVRNLVLSNDGFQLYADFHNEMHSFYLQAGGGYSPIDKNVEAAYMTRDWAGVLDHDGLTYVGRLLYEWDGGRLRLALSGAKGGQEFTAAPGDFLGNGTIDLVFWIASAQYNTGPWGFTVEYMQEPLEWDGFTSINPVGALLDGSDSTAEGYYLQGTYRFDPEWELLLRYEASYADKNDHQGNIKSAASGMPGYHFFSKIWTLGLLWEPIENLTLRAEYSQADGTLALSSRDNPDPSRLKQNWDMFSLLLSYSF